MPFPPKKSTPPAASAADAVKYLSGAAPAAPDDESAEVGQTAETGDMSDPCYQHVHALVTQYGKDKVQSDLDKISAEESAEETQGGAPSDQSPDVSEVV